MLADGERDKKRFKEVSITSFTDYAPFGFLEEPNRTSSFNSFLKKETILAFAKITGVHNSNIRVSSNVFKIISLPIPFNLQSKFQQLYFLFF